MNRRNFLTALALAPLAPLAAKLAALEGPTAVAAAPKINIGALQPNHIKCWSRQLFKEVANSGHLTSGMIGGDDAPIVMRRSR